MQRPSQPPTDLREPHCAAQEPDPGRTGAAAGPDTVEIVPLTVDTACMVDARQWLSPDEIDMAERFVQAADRDDFMAARGTLRRLLRGRIGARPDVFVFANLAYGKPSLAFPQTGGATFNVSHSGGLVAIALGSGGRPVSVDIVRRGRAARIDGIVGHLRAGEAQDCAIAFGGPRGRLSAHLVAQGGLAQSRRPRTVLAAPRHGCSRRSVG